MNTFIKEGSLSIFGYTAYELQSHKWRLIHNEVRILVHDMISIQIKLLHRMPHNNLTLGTVVYMP